MKNGCSRTAMEGAQKSSQERSSLRFGHVMREFRTHLKTRFPNLSLTPRRAPHGSRENNVFFLPGCHTFFYSSPSVVPLQLPLLGRILRGLLRYLLRVSQFRRGDALDSALPSHAINNYGYRILVTRPFGSAMASRRDVSNDMMLLRLFYARRTFPLSLSSLIPTLVRYSIHRLHICYRRSNHLSISTNVEHCCKLTRQYCHPETPCCTCSQYRMSN